MKSALVSDVLEYIDHTLKGNTYIPNDLPIGLT